jgi:membrane protein implicated in regulation of membrane protease activity
VLTASAPLAVWAQWTLFAALAIISMVLFRSRVYQKLRGQMPAVGAGPAGGVLTLQVALAPGESCKAEHGGSFWTVRNDSAAPIQSGTRVRITGVRDLTLLVIPDV